MTRRILITGERDWTDRHPVFLAMWSPVGPGIHWILGDCKTGVDEFARRICEEHSLPHVVHRVDSARPSPQRYHERNQRMVDDSPDEFIAFWSGRTNPSGTLDTMRRCASAGIGGRVVVP